MSKRSTSARPGWQWSLWRMLTLITAAGVLLGLLRPSWPLAGFDAALLVVAGWLLSGTAIVACLLLLQAPLFLFVRWRLRRLGERPEETGDVVLNGPPSSICEGNRDPTARP